MNMEQLQPGCQYQPPSLYSLSLEVVMRKLYQAMVQYEDDAWEPTRSEILNSQQPFIPPINQGIVGLLGLTGKYAVTSVSCDVQRSDAVQPTKYDWIQAFYLNTKLALDDKLDIEYMCDHANPKFECRAWPTGDLEVVFNANFSSCFMGWSPPEPYNDENEIKFKQSFMANNTVKVITWFARKPPQNEKATNWSFIEHTITFIPSERKARKGILIWKKLFFLHRSCRMHSNYDLTISWKCKAGKVRNYPDYLQ